MQEEKPYGTEDRAQAELYNYKRIKVPALPVLLKTSPDKISRHCPLFMSPNM